MEPLPAQPNKSLLDGLEVLLALAQRRSPVGVRELGRELGMTPTRVQRYLGTLAHAGLTARTETGRYAVGPGIHALSAMSLSASGLAGRAMAILPRFGELEMVVALGVLWRNTVNYLYFSVPGMAVSESIGRDEGYPAMQSSIGMLMLAWETDGTIKKYFPEDAAQILKSRAGIRSANHALVKQPSGETSVAVPVGNPPVAGLAFSGHIREAEIPELLGRMKKAADELVVANL